jgi:hypothetical protein
MEKGVKQLVVVKIVKIVNIASLLSCCPRFAHVLVYNDHLNFESRVLVHGGWA